MPRVNWGISADDIDNFDRDSQYTPYAGPVPPGNAVYQFLVKTVKFVAGTQTKNPQLRVGLELVPRASNPDERRYKGYFVVAFMSITDRNAFAYVPFLDCLGVSGSDFKSRTIADEQGNVKRIGRWQNTGDTLVLAQLKDGEYNGKERKEVGTFLPAAVGDIDDLADDESDDYEYDDDESEEFDDDYEDDDDLDAEEFDDEYADDEEEPPPPRRRAPPAKRQTVKIDPRTQTPPRRSSTTRDGRQTRRRRNDDF